MGYYSRIKRSLNRKVNPPASSTAVCIESLEQRRMLSAAAASGAPTSNPARRLHERRTHAPLPAVFAALGDSYSKEYEFFPPDRSTARDFVEQMATAGIANFGTFSSRPRPDGQGQGYANDWAQSGATSADLGAQVQGLLPTVASGAVNDVTIYIGGNDFENALPLRRSNLVLKMLPQIVFSRISSGIDTLLAASPNVKIIVSTLQDMEATPSVAGYPAHHAATLATLQLADAEQDIVNSDLDSLAQHQPRVAIAHFASQLNDVESEPTFDLDGVSIDTTTNGDFPTHLFLADKEHIGTVEQGLFADLLISAADSKFGQSIPLLTGAQILRDARLRT